MKESKQVVLIGAALGWGAQKIETYKGPACVKRYLSLRLSELWQDCLAENLENSENKTLSYEEKCELIKSFVFTLAVQTEQAVRSHKFPIVVGGDHSIAIGTWSGIRAGCNAPLGLMWFDAHMDSHTLATSP